jgi:hypothetical protein
MQLCIRISQPDRLAVKMPRRMSRNDPRRRAINRLGMMKFA